MGCRPICMAPLITSILLLSTWFPYAALARTYTQGIPSQTAPFPHAIETQASPLADPTEPKKISFFLHGSLVGSQPAVMAPLPFAKPAGIFPPMDGILIPDGNVVTDPLSTSVKGATESAAGFELGVVTAIDGNLTEGHEMGSPTVGRAKGIYVASSEEGGGLMMALTVTFSVNAEGRDSLSFFGVHRTDGLVTHVPVIGGTGRYENANGYASIRSVGTINGNGVVDGLVMGLRFNVHLNY